MAELTVGSLVQVPIWLRVFVAGPRLVSIGSLSGYSYGMPFTGGGMQRNAEADAREGYAGNAVAYACIRKIAMATASVELQPWQKDSGDLVEMHPVLDLLARSNRHPPRSVIAALITSRLAAIAFVMRQPWGKGKSSKARHRALSDEAVPHCCAG